MSPIRLSTHHNKRLIKNKQIDHTKPQASRVFGSVQSSCWLQECHQCCSDASETTARQNRRQKLWQHKKAPHPAAPSPAWWSEGTQTDSWWNTGFTQPSWFDCKVVYLMIPFAENIPLLVQPECWPIFGWALKMLCESTYFLVPTNTSHRLLHTGHVTNKQHGTAKC